MKEEEMLVEQTYAFDTSSLKGFIGKRLSDGRDTFIVQENKSFHNPCMPNWIASCNKKKNIRPASQQEILWLQACREEGKYVECPIYNPPIIY